MVTSNAAYGKVHANWKNGSNLWIITVVRLASCATKVYFESKKVLFYHFNICCFTFFELNNSFVFCLIKLQQNSHEQLSKNAKPLVVQISWKIANFHLNGMETHTMDVQLIHTITQRDGALQKLTKKEITLLDKISMDFVVTTAQSMRCI